METNNEIGGPLHLIRCMGQLTVMYLLEKADVLADKFDTKLAQLMDLGDEDGSSE